MKLSASGGRSAAKDFWGLYVMRERGVGGGDLRVLLDAFVRKYASDDVGHVVRSLAYFGDADAGPFPPGMTPELWRQIKLKFAEAVRAM
jgi:hypothetical protein